MSSLDAAHRPVGPERLCLALDLLNRDEIIGIVEQLKNLVGYVKINSAFTLYGPELVEVLLDRGVKVFADLKFHDIPHTLAGYGKAVTRLGAHLVTMHAAGGLDMMRAAVAAADDAAHALGIQRPKLVGVTLLSSVGQEILTKELNIQGSVQDEVRRRAQLAAEAGLDGIVCAPSDIRSVRPELPENFFYITPGTRSPGDSCDDHRRTGTHADAIADGASLLVLGRQVLQATDRREAVRRILTEIGGASADVQPSA